MNSLNSTSEDTANTMINDLDALMRKIVADTIFWPLSSPL